ncbi:YdcH family protein [Pseudoalteromonas aliena]|uniref:YdcH family protein n=1 Tax=Pseudoalteromonas aliena TaxID=247523 RepID=UPI00311FAF7C
MPKGLPIKTKENNYVRQNHSIANEFPQYTNTSLIKSDVEFALQVEKYNLLDTQIRELELEKAPIDDEAMHQLKHDRAVLKDIIYKRLTSK